MENTPLSKLRKSAVTIFSKVEVIYEMILTMVLRVNGWSTMFF